MQILVYRKVVNDPEPENAGTVQFNVLVLDESYEHISFSSSALVTDIVNDETDEISDELKSFLSAAGLNTGDTTFGIAKLLDFVKACAQDAAYNPTQALDVHVEFDPWDGFINEGNNFDGVDHYDGMEEALQASFEETDTESRPASKDVVRSLPRKIHTKVNDQEEECAVCLEEFMDGGTIVTLPCQHRFDEECIVKWLEIDHICPLCRYELPCDDDEE